MPRKIDVSFLLSVDHYNWLDQMREKYKVIDIGKTVRILCCYAEQSGDEASIFTPSPTSKETQNGNDEDLDKKTNVATKNLVVGLYSQQNDWLNSTQEKYNKADVSKLLALIINFCQSPSPSAFTNEKIFTHIWCKDSKHCKNCSHHGCNKKLTQKKKRHRDG